MNDLTYSGGSPVSVGFVVFTKYPDQCLFLYHSI